MKLYMDVNCLHSKYNGRRLGILLFWRMARLRAKICNTCHFVAVWFHPPLLRVFYFAISLCRCSLAPPCSRMSRSVFNENGPLEICSSMLLSILLVFCIPCQISIQYEIPIFLTRNIILPVVSEWNLFCYVRNS